MNELMNLLKGAAPALATAVAGPMGGMAVKAIADKLGVPPSITEVTNALQENPDLALKLKEIDTRAFEAETKAVTDRWQADMASDSWLSKNIRPGTLVYILTAYLGFAVADGFGFHIAESYVSLLGQWGMLVMTAYFGGRSAEKIVGVLKGNK
jgi:hypothetical protein